MQENTVYQLDKPIGETWTQDEVSYLVSKYMVEVESLKAVPFRVVAMCAPPDGKPIYMTWRADCTVLAVPYSKRWEVDSFAAERECDGMPGNLIPDILRRMVELAKGRAQPVKAHLNGLDVLVKDGDSAEERWAWMQGEWKKERQESERKHAAWLLTQEGIEATRKAAERQHYVDAEVAKGVLPIEVKDQAAYDSMVEKNSQDGYSACTVRYAARWANWMEKKIAEGAKVEDIAKQTGHDADIEGITGFMYGCAVSILAQFWEHGEALRRWHNLDTQIKDEGEKANETGGVLNPALLSVG